MSCRERAKNISHFFVQAYYSELLVLRHTRVRLSSSNAQMEQLFSSAATARAAGVWNLLKWVCGVGAA